METHHKEVPKEEVQPKKRKTRNRNKNKNKTAEEVYKDEVILDLHK